MNFFENVLFGSTIGLGLISACIALYGRYRVLPPSLTGPNICKLEEGGCQVLFRTPAAALLGVPNSALAVVFYPALAAGLFFHLPLILLWGISSVAFVMKVYLAWTLLKNHLECRICWMGHVCNGVIWTILLIQWIREI